MVSGVRSSNHGIVCSIQFKSCSKLQTGKKGKTNGDVHQYMCRGGCNCVSKANIAGHSFILLHQLLILLVDIQHLSNTLGSCFCLQNIHTWGERERGVTSRTTTTAHLATMLLLLHASVISGVSGCSDKERNPNQVMQTPDRVPLTLVCLFTDLPRAGKVVVVRRDICHHRALIRLGRCMDVCG